MGEWTCALDGSACAGHRAGADAPPACSSALPTRAAGHVVMSLSAMYNRCNGRSSGRPLESTLPNTTFAPLPLLPPRPPSVSMHERMFVAKTLQSHLQAPEAAVNISRLEQNSLNVARMASLLGARGRAAAARAPATAGRGASGARPLAPAAAPRALGAPHRRSSAAPCRSQLPTVDATPAQRVRCWTGYQPHHMQAQLALSPWGCYMQALRHSMQANAAEGPS